MNNFEQYIKPISVKNNELIYNLNDVYKYYSDEDLSEFLSIGKVWSIYSESGLKYCTVTRINDAIKILLMYKKSFSSKNCTIQIYTGGIGTKIKIIMEIKQKIKQIL